MSDVVFIDFDDSFSYNVIQELEAQYLKVRVIHWLDFEELPQEKLLVLGPGPGHPLDYQQIFPLLKRWLDKKRAFFGVCLGHQIFWHLQGLEVIKSKNPMHGQKVLLQLDQDWKKWLGLSSPVFVQRYNSLSVPSTGLNNYPNLQNFIQDSEIMITRGENLITYQFHPESLGTSFRSSFFVPVKRLVV